MSIYYYFKQNRGEIEKEVIKSFYGDDVVFINQRPWNILNQLTQEDFVICKSVDELADVVDIKDNIDAIVLEYMNIKETGAELMFDKSTQCNSIFIQTLVSDTQDFKSILKKCILNYCYQKDIETSYGKKHKVSADKNGRKIGIKKGTKLVTKKSIEMKARIRAMAKEFGGTLTDEELIKELNLSRNTYFKYKKDIKGE